MLFEARRTSEKKSAGPSKLDRKMHLKLDFLAKTCYSRTDLPFLQPDSTATSLAFDEAGLNYLSEKNQRDFEAFGWKLVNINNALAFADDIDVINRFEQKAA